MNKKMEIPGHIWAEKNNWSDDLRYQFVSGNTDMTTAGWLKVCPYTLAFEIPADFNPVAAMVSVLEKQRDKVKREFNERIQQINDQISKLQCLTFEPSEEV